MPFTPHDAARHTIDRAVALLGTASSASGSVANDLRRLAIVMAVAALDTYMHRLIVERVYQHDELPGKLAKLSLPFEYALSQADEAACAARAKPHNSRPRVALKRELRDRLLRETFQHFDDVSTALGMAGLSGNWEAIGQQLQPALLRKQIKRRLNAIVGRRDRIVHEGDYLRLERPQSARLTPVSHAEATRDVEFLRRLVDAIHTVA